MNQSNQKGALVIIDVSNNKVIGSSRFFLLGTFPEGIEIGWTFLAKKYWGGKYNAAVKKLMIEHAFQFFKYIVFYVDKDNFRSQRAVEKLGATKLRRRWNRKTNGDWSKTILSMP